MKQTRSAREWSGLELAALNKLATDGVLWQVPSQTTEKIYTVNFVQGTCSCTDYGTRKVKCKHLWAVEFTIIREAGELKATPADYDGSAFAARALQEIDQGRGDLPF